MQQCVWISIVLVGFCIIADVRGQRPSLAFRGGGRGPQNAGLDQESASGPSAESLPAAAEEERSAPAAAAAPTRQQQQQQQRPVFGGRRGPQFQRVPSGSDAAVSAENNNEETPAQPPVQNTRPQRRRPVAPAASAPDAETPQKSSSESSVPNSNPFRRRPAAPPVQPEEPQQEVQQQRREQLPAVQSTSSLADVDAADPAADGEFVSECPIADGFFADAFECDRYYECRGNKISEKVCKDGLVFNDYSVKFGRCDFPFNVDCTDRPKLQPAQPSPNCPRSNGYFAHPDPKECTKFFFCSDGVDNPITCPGGLIFDPKKGQCAWPEDAKREGCLAEELFEFNCPKQSNQDFNGPQRQQHPRFADPKDCQFFYLCIDGVTPRKNGCPLGRVFNQETGLCDEPENVLDCIDWYKDDPRFLTSTTSTSPRPRPTAKNSRVRPNRTRATTARALTRFSDRNVQKQEQQTF